MKLVVAQKVCPKCGKKQENSGCLLGLGILGIIFGVILLSSGLDGILNSEVSKKQNNLVDSSALTTEENNNSIVSSHITKENYDKIQNGMTEKEIEDLLGEPESISENEIEGFGKTVLKHYQETFSLKAIDVFFKNGKVYMKNWTDL